MVDPAPVAGASGTVVRVAGFPARHGFSTAALGSMGLTGATDATVVLERRGRLADELGFDLGRAALAGQVHGTAVRAFRRGDRPEGGQSVLKTDALATDIPGMALLTFHADCFPLLFADPQTGAIAAAHAGWRGLLRVIPAATVAAMREAYGTRPVDLRVLIGPGVCGSCYEVGKEVAMPMEGRFGRADRYLRPHGERWLLDLAALACLQLEDLGVTAGQVRQAGSCTREDRAWFSHRGGRQGRFLSAIVA